MRIRALLVCGAFAITAAGATAATAGAASASPRPVAEATGSVALSGPTQYAAFTARPGPGHSHGSMDYANFTYQVTAPVNTNVWNISGQHALTFTVGSSTYQHTMNVTTITPLSTHSTRFAGTGSYGTTYTWKVAGTVSWNAVSFVISYNEVKYQVSGHGTINADGSVSGTARDSNGTALTFTMPAGSAFQVLRYTAPVTWASVSHHNASFVFTIPNNMPAGLAGVPVIVKVHDGGPGFRHDTYAHGVATSPHNGSVTNYPITSGNIRVTG